MKFVVAAALFGMGASSAAVGASLFGSVEFRTGPLPPLSEWRQTFERIERERPIYRACKRSPAACPSDAAIAWEALIERQAGHPTIEQLDAVNRFINGWQYKTDQENYGRHVRWATPLEFFKRSGDCEDYAIAKYVTLRRFGIRPDQLRIVVVWDLVRETSHAVLAVDLGDRIHILDNLTNTVRPEPRVAGYVPIYSVNETARWVYVTLATLPRRLPSRLNRNSQTLHQEKGRLSRSVDVALRDLSQRSLGFPSRHQWAARRFVTGRAWRGGKRSNQSVVAAAPDLPTLAEGNLWPPQGRLVRRRPIPIASGCKSRCRFRSEGAVVSTGGFTGRLVRPVAARRRGGAALHRGISSYWFQSSWRPILCETQG